MNLRAFVLVNVLGHILSLSNQLKADTVPLWDQIPNVYGRAVGPQTELIQNPDFLLRAVQMIRTAKKNIYINFFIFGGPRANIIIDEALKKRAAGVEVKVLLDPALGGLTSFVHTQYTKAMVERLKSENVDYAIVSSIPFGYGRSGRRVNQLPINHNKYLVIDDDKMLLGSINLAPAVDTMFDVAIGVTGVNNNRLKQQFLFDYHFSKQDYSLEDYSEACTKLPLVPQHVRVKVYSNGHCRLDVMTGLIALINRAQKSIDIFVEEIEPIPEVFNALEAALKRGVKIRVLTEPGDASLSVGEIGKFVPQGIVSARAVAKLIQMGAEVRLYNAWEEKTTSHLKTMIVDNLILNLGSANWTDGGFFWVYETNIEVFGGVAVAQYAKLFNQKFKNSRGTDGPSPLSYWLRSVLTWYMLQGAE